MYLLFLVILSQTSAKKSKIRYVFLCCCYVYIMGFIKYRSFALKKKTCYPSIIQRGKQKVCFIMQYFSLAKDNTSYHQYHSGWDQSTSVWVRRWTEHQDFSEYTVWPKDGNVAVLNSKWVFTDWCLHHKLVTALLCITFPSETSPEMYWQLLRVHLH